MNYREDLEIKLQKVTLAMLEVEEDILKTDQEKKRIIDKLIDFKEAIISKSIKLNIELRLRIRCQLFHIPIFKKHALLLPAEQSRGLRPFDLGLLAKIGQHAQLYPFDLVLSLLALNLKIIILHKQLPISLLQI